MFGIERLKSWRQLRRAPELLRCRQLTTDWFALARAYTGTPTLPFRISLPTGPVDFVEPADIATFWQIFCSQLYPVFPSDKFIIDAGANVGMFSLYALLSAPQSRLISIEPAPDSCERLANLLEAHGLRHRCELHRAALGASRGTTHIDLRAGSQFRRTGHNGIPVQLETLAEFVRTDVDLLKLDVEGAEYEVLATVSPVTISRIKRVAMEYHPNGVPFTIESFFERQGFRTTRQRDDGGGYGVLWFERSEYNKDGKPRN